MNKCSDTALPLTTVKAFRPTLSKECDQRSNKLQGHLVKIFSEGDCFTQSGFPFFNVRDLISSRATSLDIKKLHSAILDTTFGIIGFTAQR
jgi:hypothetical protein